MTIDENTSDGFHTFKELYEHRFELFLSLCHARRADAWRSKLHGDGTMFEGWFVLGLFHKAGKQMTYHLPLSRWSDCHWAKTFERVPGFDGHASNDVLARLREMRK